MKRSLSRARTHGRVLNLFIVSLFTLIRLAIAMYQDVLHRLNQNPSETRGETGMSTVHVEVASIMRIRRISMDHEQGTIPLILPHTARLIEAIAAMTKSRLGINIDRTGPTETGLDLQKDKRAAVEIAHVRQSFALVEQANEPTMTIITRRSTKTKGVHHASVARETTRSADQTVSGPDDTKSLRRMNKSRTIEESTAIEQSKIHGENLKLGKGQMNHE